MGRKSKQSIEEASVINLWNDLQEKTIPVTEKEVDIGESIRTIDDILKQLRGKLFSFNDRPALKLNNRLWWACRVSSYGNELSVLLPEKDKPKWENITHTLEDIQGDIDKLIDDSSKFASK